MFERDALTCITLEQSPVWEANRFVASQEIPRILLNLKVHYCIHNCLPPVSILSQPNPVHTPTSWRSILISSHLCLGLPSTTYFYFDAFHHVYLQSCTWDITNQPLLPTAVKIANNENIATETPRPKMRSITQLLLVSPLMYLQPDRLLFAPYFQRMLWVDNRYTHKLQSYIIRHHFNTQYMF
jgi:hypothetical protein